MSNLLLFLIYCFVSGELVKKDVVITSRFNIQAVAYLSEQGKLAFISVYRIFQLSSLKGGCDHFWEVPLFNDLSFD